MVGGAPDTLWRIEMLGGLRACGQGATGALSITRFRTHKTGALLAYLAQRPGPHPREALVDLLWPDASLAAGRRSLRVALSSLRHQVEPPGVPSGAVLSAARETVGLNPHAITTDVAAFEAVLEAARAAAGHADVSAQTRFLREAVRLYRGSLLPGFYESWIAPEEQRLEQLFLDALRRLIALEEAAGNAEGALALAQRGLKTDPLDEELQRLVMRLLAAQGQASAALRQYHHLERLLHAQMGDAPAPATRQLALHIEREIENGTNATGAGLAAASQAVSEREQRKDVTAQATAPAAAGAADIPPVGGHLPLEVTRFFGREEETAALHDVLRDDGVRLVTLMGAGGTGKTRLALEAARRLRDGKPQQWRAVWRVPLAAVSEARPCARRRKLDGARPAPGRGRKPASSRERQNPVAARVARRRAGHHRRHGGESGRCRNGTRAF